MRKITINEVELVRGILKGQEKDLRKFLHHFERPLSTYISKRVENPEDREEILQDTFLATLEGLRDFSFRSSLFTYICSIANHKVIDYYRKKKIKNIVFSKISEIEPLLATLLGPEEALDEELLRQKIKTTFKKLTPMYEKILKLKYIYGYSVSEIAEKLSISFKSAESQLFRARRAFVSAYSIWKMKSFINY